MAFQPPAGTAPPARAGWWQRAAAALIDGLIIAVAVIAAIVLAGGSGHGATTTVALIGSLAGQIFYGPLLLMRSGAHNGQTIGKQVTGYRVVRLDGRPVDARTAFLREAIGKGVLGFVGPYSVVDSLYPIFDRDRQAVHDKLASTFVVPADYAAADVRPVPFTDAVGEQGHGWTSSNTASWPPEPLDPAGGRAAHAERAGREAEAAPAEPEPASPAPPAFLPPRPASPPQTDDDDPPRGPFGPSSSAPD